MMMLLLRFWTAKKHHKKGQGMTSAERFVNECCESGAGSSLLSEIFGEYVRFSLENKLETLTQYGFGEAVSRMGYPKSHCKPGKTPVIIGLVVKP